MTRLTAGKPMLFKPIRHSTDIAIMFGETKPDILRELEQAGSEIPAAYMAAAEKDPL